MDRGALAGARPRERYRAAVALSARVAPADDDDLGGRRGGEGLRRPDIRRVLPHRDGVVEDATPGMQCAFARDLEGFETWMTEPGDPPETIRRWVDLRRRGRDASNLTEALAAARAWTAEN